MATPSANVGEILAGRDILYKNRRIFKTVEALAKANRLAVGDLLNAMLANRDADITELVADTCRAKGVRVNALL